MSWTLTTSGVAVMKAGANVNTDAAASGVILSKFSDLSESYINTATRKDWVADYANVTANFKEILSEVSSDIIAKKLIAYDMSGYTSRIEAATMLDVLDDNINNAIKILREDFNKEKML